MKNIKAFMTMVFAAMAFGASAQEMGSKKTLVVYFSLPETVNNDRHKENSTVSVNGEILGNTQYMADLIAGETDADIFRIEPVTPYDTSDHSALTAFAREEQRKNARPQFSGGIENIAGYDTVFVGYPNWWGDMPMILYTFFDRYDFAGKTLVPFNTHGGSGFSSTIQTIARLEPRANVVHDGLSLSRNNMESAPQRVKEWLENLKL